MHNWPPEKILVVGDSWGFLCPITCTKEVQSGATIPQIDAVVRQDTHKYHYDIVVVYAGVAHRYWTGESIATTKWRLDGLKRTIKEFHNYDSIYIEDWDFMYDSILANADRRLDVLHPNKAGWDVLLAWLPFVPERTD